MLMLGITDAALLSDIDTYWNICSVGTYTYIGM